MPEALERCVSSLLEKWKKDPGSRPEPKEEGQDAEQQAYAICTAMLKEKGVMGDFFDTFILETVGPTVLGAAITNRPHIKNMPPIQIIGDEGDERLLVHLVKRGRFRYRGGELVFDDATLQSFIDNFKMNRVGIDISLDHRHKPDFGAVGWFEDLFMNGDWLCALVKPTPTGLEVIKNGQFRYASIEFHPDWEHPEIRMSLDDLEEDMNEINLEEYRQLVEERDSLVTEMSELEERLTALESEADQQRDLVDRYRAMWVESLVNNVVMSAENYRDDDGRGHPPVFVDWVRDTLSLAPIGDGDDAVKLEDRGSADEVVAYFRKAIARLVNILPGSVMLSTQTEGDKDRDLGNEDDDNVEDFAKEVWAM